jgi:L-threonylcarbamoyladenylate synthase
MKEAEMLKQGKIGVMPTDTLYGLVASVSRKEAIKRVYDLKKRSSAKPSIILISSLGDLGAFGVVLTEGQRKVLARFWPGPVSIVLPCGIAFRLPNNTPLISFLKESGPCIAPSANPEGLPPAETIEEVKKYFGDKVDFYKDGGECSGGMPSTLIALDEQGVIKVLRQGGTLI